MPKFWVTKGMLDMSKAHLCGFCKGQYCPELKSDCDLRSLTTKTLWLRHTHNECPLASCDKTKISNLIDLR